MIYSSVSHINGHSYADSDLSPDLPLVMQVFTHGAEPASHSDSKRIALETLIRKKTYMHYYCDDLSVDIVLISYHHVQR